MNNEQPRMKNKLDRESKCKESDEAENTLGIESPELRVVKGSRNTGMGNLKLYA